jgi:hypothetical protein
MSFRGCRRELWLEVYFRSTSLGGGGMWDPNSPVVAVLERLLEVWLGPWCFFSRLWVRWGQYNGVGSGGACYESSESP